MSEYRQQSGDLFEWLRGQPLIAAPPPAEVVTEAPPLAEEQTSAEDVNKVASETLEDEQTGAEEIDFDPENSPDVTFSDLPVLEAPISSSGPYLADEIVESAFEYFRATGFPYRILAPHECMQAINQLAATPTENLFHSAFGIQVANSFHPHRYEGKVHGKKTPYEAFHDDALLKKTLAFELRESGGLGKFVNSLAVASGTQGCANFRPGFALSIYRRFAPANGVVFDPCTGYGGRLVGFLASQCQTYVGCDPNTPTHAGNSRMAEALGVADRVHLYCSAIEDWDPLPWLQRCDCAFTSPPYFSKERYSEEDTQSWRRYPEYPQWLDGFVFPLLEQCSNVVKPGGYTIINIADVKIAGKRYELVADAKRLAARCGLTLIEEEQLYLGPRMYQYDTGDQAIEAVLIFKVQPPQGGTS